jgi:hypothetical protein
MGSASSALLPLLHPVSAKEKQCPPEEHGPFSDVLSRLQNESATTMAMDNLVVRFSIYSKEVCN